MRTYTLRNSGSCSPAPEGHELRDTLEYTLRNSGSCSPGRQGMSQGAPCGYTLGLYEKAMPAELNWKEKLTAAGRAGFDFVEISIDETDEKLRRLDMSRDERMELVSLMAETGVPIRRMCLSGHREYPFGSRDPEICRRSMEIMEKAILLADDLGIRIIQLAG